MIAFIEQSPRWVLARAAWILSVALITAGCNRTDPTPEQRPLRLGINIEGLAYWGTEAAFVNLAKMASPWLTQCDPRQDPYCADGLFGVAGANSWNTKEQDKLDLDEQGYPRSLPDVSQGTVNHTNFTSVSTLIPTGLSPLRTSGRFVVRYDGEGRLVYGRGATRNAALSKPGRDVLDVTTDGNQTWFQLTIAATDPRKSGRYLRNIRIFPEGGACASDPALACSISDTGEACPNNGTCRSFEDSETDQPFHPAFLANLRPFRAIRFMAFQNTNASWTERWDQRTSPERFTWVSDHADGGPVEMIVALGNRTGTDIWVNMPTRSDDDYVRQFATYVHDHLQPARRVYVEYSNEVWNTAFPGGAWVEAKALARWPNAKDTPFGKRLQWYGMRAAQICDLWHQVFAADSARLTCIMGAQAANPWTAKQALECPLWASEAGNTPCVKHGIQGLAVAPYFGFYIGNPKHLPALRSWAGQPGGGLDSVFAEVFDGGEFDDGPQHGALSQASEHMRLSAAVARNHGLELVAYEGGQHLVGLAETLNDKSANELLMAANRDTRMGEAYALHLADWQAAGGGLYNLWNSVSPYTLWGSWGLKEYRDQADAPKYDAAVRAVERAREKPAQPELPSQALPSTAIPERTGLMPPADPSPASAH
ncbi:cellulose-binding protein [Methylolobus aquaticus]